MSNGSQLAESGQAFTRDRHTNHRIRASATRYVLRRAQSPKDALVLLDALGLRLDGRGTP